MFEIFLNAFFQIRIIYEHKTAVETFMFCSNIKQTSTN